MLDARASKNRVSDAWEALAAPGWGGGVCKILTTADQKGRAKMHLERGIHTHQTSFLPKLTPCVCKIATVLLICGCGCFFFLQNRH